MAIGVNLKKYQFIAGVSAALIGCAPSHREPSSASLAPSLSAPRMNSSSPTSVLRCHGVEIVSDDRAADKRFSVRLLTVDQAALARSAAAAAISAYPVGFCNEELRRVCVYKNLIQPSGAEVLGLYNDDGTIYATYAPAYRSIVRYLGPIPIQVSQLEGADRQLARTVHHEFSSILRNRYFNQFPIDAWNRANPSDFKYTEQRTVDTTDETWDYRLCKVGFLCAYAKTSAEDDFNVIAAELFMGDPQFWKLVDRHSRLAKKVDLAIGFYNGMDARFTPSWFRSLTKSSPE